MGFKPNPSMGLGTIMSKGLDVVIKKIKKIKNKLF